MTKQSGSAVLRKYGREHFRNLRKKVRKSSLENSGRKGGLSFIEKYGKEKLKELSERGHETFKKRIKMDADLRKQYRSSFIEKMKKFTRVYPTKSGILVRSKLEQKVADYLTENKIDFQYESLSFDTKFGICEPDFVIGSTIVEVFGMDTDFYISKKTRKLHEAIRANPQFKWVILNRTKANIQDCIVINNVRQLVPAIRG